MDQDAFLVQQQQQHQPNHYDASAHHSPAGGVPQHHLQQLPQQVQDSWGAPSDPLASGMVPPPSTSQFQGPSPTSPTHAPAFYTGNQQAQQPPQTLSSDMYAVQHAMATTGRPSTALSLNMGALSVESAAPSPLTAGPSPFTHYPSNTIPAYPQNPSHSQPPTVAAYGATEQVFTYNAPSPNTDWPDHHTIGRSHSSSALVYPTGLVQPHTARRVPHLPPNALRTSSSMSAIHEHEHQHHNLPNQQSHPNPQIAYPSQPILGYPEHDPHTLHLHSGFAATPDDNLTPVPSRLASASFSSNDIEPSYDEYGAGTPIEADDDSYGSMIPPPSSSGSSEPYDDPPAGQTHGTGSEPALHHEFPAHSSQSPEAEGVPVKREVPDTSPSIPASISGEATNSTANSSRTTAPKANSSLTSNNFVSKLYNMITDERSGQYIFWTKGGHSFMVSNTGEFSRTILGSHFKHNNFSSFVRQLNMYGFHKTNRTPRSTRANAENQEWEFSHPKFIQGRMDLIEEIKRRNVEPNESSSTITQRATLAPMAPRQHPTQDLMTSIGGLHSSHDDLLRAYWAERGKVEQLTTVVKEMHDVLTRLCPSDVMLHPFPDTLLDDGTEMYVHGTAISPGGSALLPRARYAPVGTGSYLPQWGDPLPNPPSPKASPTALDSPHKRAASGRHPPPLRMNIPTLPPGLPSVGGPRSAVDRKLSSSSLVPSRPDERISAEAEAAAIEADRLDELRADGRGSVKRQRLNPTFDLNAIRESNSVSDLSSPSPGGATFSAPSSATPSAGSYSDVHNTPTGRPPAMSITIPSAPFLSPHTTGRLGAAMSGAGSLHGGRTLLRARSDSAPHGVGLGHLWHVNFGGGHDPAPRDLDPHLTSLGRPRSGTHQLSYTHVPSNLVGVSQSHPLASTVPEIDPSTLSHPYQPVSNVPSVQSGGSGTGSTEHQTM